MGELYNRLRDVMADGQRHALPSLASAAGADVTIGDVRHALTVAWEQGEPVDADSATGLPDWWWWRTDAVHDPGLLGILDHPAGRTTADAALLLRVSRPTTSRRIRRLIDAGLVERHPAWPAPRYHLTAAGRAAMEQT